MHFCVFHIHSIIDWLAWRNGFIRSTKLLYAGQG